MDDKQNTADPPFIKLRTSTGIESTHYFALYEGLPEEFRLRAEKELNETEEKLKRGIQRLREFTKKEKVDSLDDYLLLAVLRSCKFNLKKSESKLRNFVSHRRGIIQKIAKVTMSDAERILDDLAIGILPYRDKHGRVIVFTRPYGMHFEDYAIEDATTLVMALLLFLLTFDMTTVSGLAYYAECKSPSIYIFYPIIKMIRHAIPIVLSYPLRIAKVEVLNEFTLIRWFYKILSPILPDKLSKRVKFNGEGYENLHKLYSSEILPEEFGGKRGPLSSKFFKEKFLDFVRELKTEAKGWDSSNHHHRSS